MASSEWNFSVLKLWKQKRKTETHNHRNPQCRVKSSDRPKHTHVLFFPQEDFLTGAIRRTNWRHDPPLPGTPADQRRPLSLCSGGGTGRGHSSLHLLSSWPAWLAYALDDLDTRHASSEDKQVFFHSTSAREAQQFQVSSKIFTIFLFNNCPIVTLSRHIHSNFITTRIKGLAQRKWAVRDRVVFDHLDVTQTKHACRAQPVCHSRVLGGVEGDYTPNVKKTTKINVPADMEWSTLADMMVQIL